MVASTWTLLGARMRPAWSWTSSGGTQKIAEYGENTTPFVTMALAYARWKGDILDLDSSRERDLSMLPDRRRAGETQRQTNPTTALAGPNKMGSEPERTDLGPAS